MKALNNHNAGYVRRVAGHGSTLLGVGGVSPIGPVGTSAGRGFYAGVSARHETKASP